MENKIEVEENKSLEYFQQKEKYFEKSLKSDSFTMPSLEKRKVSRQQKTK